MPMIKFSYFDIEAKGELTRLLLHAGNFDFEDDRLPISSWPGEHKEKTTFGQLPMAYALLGWSGAGTVDGDRQVKLPLGHLYL